MGESQPVYNKQCALNPDKLICAAYMPGLSRKPDDRSSGEPDLNRSPGDRRGAERPGGSKGREV